MKNSAALVIRMQIIKSPIHTGYLSCENYDFPTVFATTLKTGRKILLFGNEKIINQEGVWRTRIAAKRLLKSLYERNNLRAIERIVIKYEMGLHFSMHIEGRSITIGHHKGNFEQTQTSYKYMS
jgi:hypothetical protein